MKLIIIACTALSLAACETPFPDAVDSSVPWITLSILEPQRVRLATTDPDVPLPGAGCPEGTSTTSTSAEAWQMSHYGYSHPWTEDMLAKTYFYPGSQPPFKFFVGTLDVGGVDTVTISIHDEIESGFVVDVSDFAGESEQRLRTEGEGGYALLVPTFDKPGSFGRMVIENGNDARLTTLENSFTVSSLGNATHIHIVARDFAGNDIEFIPHMLPASVCE